MVVRILMVATILLAGGAARQADAYGPQDFARWLGVGHGNGYHARTACPPRPWHASPRQAAHPPTWGSLPAP